MYASSIILFFLYCYGFGLGLGMFVKESEDFFERHLMRIGIGLGAVAAFGLLLNLIKIPLDWRIFTAISIVPIIILLLKNLKKISSVFKGIKLNVYVLVMLVIFFLTLHMYMKGAFAYPYLEDDDSWSHAVGVKYVSVEKTIFDPANRIQYIDPYPPLYDMLIGILHQTNDSVFWSLKFFNALIISLSIIFFYFFAKAFSSSSKKALFSTFILFSVPAFMSHFIWAISLTMPLFFVAFYAIEKIKDDRKWIIVSATVIAAALTSSPSHSTYFGLFFVIYFIVKTLSEKKFMFYHLIACIFGVLLSFALWWLPMILKHGVEATLRGVGLHAGGSVLSIGGTGDRVYSFSDFLCGFDSGCYNGSNTINNPVGIGIAVIFLVFAALVFFIYNSRQELKKSRMTIIISYAVIALLILYFLGSTYLKYIDTKTTRALAQGSVPFFDFLSEQRFLVITLLLFVFVLLLVIISQWKNSDKNSSYIAVALAWLAFGFYAVSAGPFEYKLSSFRAWMILAIPVSIIAGEGIYFIQSLANSIANGIIRNKNISAALSLIAICLIAFAVVKTSFIPKYKVNTAQWGSGGFWTYIQDSSGKVTSPELSGYLWLKDNIPSNAKIFTFSNDGIIIGFDKFICHWCTDVVEYQKSGFNQSAEENYNWLKKEQYQYIIIDAQAAKKFGYNETSGKLRGFINSTRFKPIFGNNGFVIFAVA